MHIKIPEALNFWPGIKHGLTLERLSAGIGIERVAALDAGGSGENNFLVRLLNRIDNGDLNRALWAAIPEASRADVRAIVVDGYSISQWTAVDGRQCTRRQTETRERLKDAADRVLAVLGDRFGRPRMRCT